MARDYSRRPTVSLHWLRGGLLLTYNSDVQQERCLQVPNITASLSISGNFLLVTKHFPPLNTSLALSTGQLLQRVNHHKSHTAQPTQALFNVYTLLFHTYTGCSPFRDYTCISKATYEVMKARYMHITWSLRMPMFARKGIFTSHYRM